MLLVGRIMDGFEEIDVTGRTAVTSATLPVICRPRVLWTLRQKQETLPEGSRDEAGERRAENPLLSWEVIETTLTVKAPADESNCSERHHT